LEKAALKKTKELAEKGIVFVWPSEPELPEGITPNPVMSLLEWVPEYNARYKPPKTDKEPEQ
jgi:hypothetical protein